MPRLASCWFGAGAPSGAEHLGHLEHHLGAGRPVDVDRERPDHDPLGPVVGRRRPTARGRRRPAPGTRRSGAAGGRSGSWAARGGRGSPPPRPCARRQPATLGVDGALADGQGAGVDGLLDPGRRWRRRPGPTSRRGRRRSTSRPTPTTSSLPRSASNTNAPSLRSEPNTGGAQPPRRGAAVQHAEDGDDAVADPEAGRQVHEVVRGWLWGLERASAPGHLDAVDPEGSAWATAHRRAGNRRRHGVEREAPAEGDGAAIATLGSACIHRARQRPAGKLPRHVDPPEMFDVRANAHVLVLSP